MFFAVSEPSANFFSARFAILCNAHVACTRWCVAHARRPHLHNNWTGPAGAISEGFLREILFLYRNANVFRYRYVRTYIYIYIYIYIYMYTAVPRAALSCARARSQYPDIYIATSYSNHELGCEVSLGLSLGLINVSKCEKWILGH